MIELQRFEIWILIPSSDKKAGDGGYWTESLSAGPSNWASLTSDAQTLQHPSSSQIPLKRRSLPRRLVVIQFHVICFPVAHLEIRVRWLICGLQHLSWSKLFVSAKYTPARAAVHPIDHSTHNTSRCKKKQSKQRGHAQTLHHVQKEVGPVMEVVERKHFHSRKCDLEGN